MNAIVAVNLSMIGLEPLTGLLPITRTAAFPYLEITRYREGAEHWAIRIFLQQGRPVQGRT